MERKTAWKIALLGAIVVILVILQVGKRDPLAGRTFVVGVYPWPPFSMKNEQTGEWTGFDIELLREVAKLQNLNLSFREIGFVDIFPDLINERIDLATTVTIIPEREKWCTFSWPTNESGLQLVIRSEDTSISNLSDLSEKTVGCLFGTAKTFCDTLKKNDQVGDIRVFEQVDPLFDALLTGQVDAVINEWLTNLYYADRTNGKLKSLPGVLTDEYCGFPIRKEEDVFRHRMNKGLRKIMSSGQYSELYQKYLVPLKRGGR
jgi:polar amino acid transport system substrate-binding protein